jgi:cytosine/adenosine deaminase-related metal-dependent hydrolase
LSEKFNTTKTNSLSSSPQALTRTLSICSNRIFRADGSFKPGIVTVNGSKIEGVEIFEHDDLVEMRAKLSVLKKTSMCFDFQDKPILPSAINSHTHLEQT